MITQSVSDERIVDDLKKSRERLLSEPESRELLSGLRRQLQSITRNLYVIRWIPEQAEDLYHVLVDGTTIVHIEIPRVRHDGAPAFKKWPVEAYMKERKAIPKRERRKLELALRLARSEGSTSLS